MSGSAVGLSTLLLDRSTWDLCLDAGGNIAVASPPYSLAQDVATACRTVIGDVYYDTTLGIPYLGQSRGRNILGGFPPLSFLKQQLVAQALTVPGVTNPVCFISEFTDRAVSGQIQFVDSNGATQIASF